MNSRKYLIVNCAGTWNAAIVELNDEQLKTVVAVCRELNNGCLNEDYPEAPYIRLYLISSVEELLYKDELAEKNYYSLYVLYESKLIKIKYNPFEMENLL